MPRSRQTEFATQFCNASAEEINNGIKILWQVDWEGGEEAGEDCKDELKYWAERMADTTSSDLVKMAEASENWYPRADCVVTTSCRTKW